MPGMGGPSKDWAVTPADADDDYLITLGAAAKAVIVSGGSDVNGNPVRFG
jgi:hypothetical protein